MRAHTITTEVGVGTMARTTYAILALSLAVVLFAATASTASITPTPAAPPLTLDVRVNGETDGSKKLYASTNHDSRLVVRGREIKKATRHLRGEGGPYPPSAAITLRPKHRVAHNAKVKVKATDKFGQTATDKLKVGVIRKGFLNKP